MFGPETYGTHISYLRSLLFCIFSSQNEQFEIIYTETSAHDMLSFGQNHKE